MKYLIIVIALAGLIAVQNVSAWQYQNSYQSPMTTYDRYQAQQSQRQQTQLLNQIQQNQRTQIRRQQSRDFNTNMDNFQKSIRSWDRY